MERARAFATVAAAYGAALLVAVSVGMAVPTDDPVWVVVWADLAATLVIFGCSVAWNNSSFYDAYWSVVPPVIGLYWATSSQADEADGLRRLVVLLLVSAWGARLTWNWARGWGGLRHEDWRYVDLRRSTGRAYWGVSFVGLHLFPTVMVLLGCLPLFASLVTGREPFGILDLVATLVTGLAIACEAVADLQLREFARSKPGPGEILNRGLWRYSRHPNYFGEMTFWWGLWLFAVAADPGAWWTAIGPAAITAMFFAASLPMIEKRMGERRPGWAEHARRTPLVVPWMPKG